MKLNIVIVIIILVTLMVPKTILGSDIYRFCKDQTKILIGMKDVNSNTPRIYAEYLEKNWRIEVPGFPGLTGEEICQHSAGKINYNFKLGFTAKDVLEMIRAGSVSTKTLEAGTFFNYGTTPDGSDIKEYSYNKSKTWRVIVGNKHGFCFGLVKIEGNEPCYNNICCMLSKTATIVPKKIVRDTVYVVLCPPLIEEVVQMEIPDSGFSEFMNGFKTVQPVTVACPRFYGIDRSFCERREGRWFNLSLGFWVNNQDIQPFAELPFGKPGAGGGDNPGGGPGGSGGDNPQGSGGGLGGAGWGHN